MDIVFLSDDLEDLCSNERRQKRDLGANGSRKLKSRLADLSAAASLGVVVAGRPHPLKGDRAGQFAVDLDAGVRLVFESADSPIPLNDDFSIDWPQVRRVRIVYIGDYHD